MDFLVVCFTEHKCGVCAEFKEILQQHSSTHSSTTVQNTISKILLEVGDYLESVQTLRSKTQGWVAVKQTIRRAYH